MNTQLAVMCTYSCPHIWILSSYAIHFSKFCCCV